MALTFTQETNSGRQQSGDHGSRLPLIVLLRCTGLIIRCPSVILEVIRKQNMRSIYKQSGLDGGGTWRYPVLRWRDYRKSSGGARDQIKPRDGIPPPIRGQLDTRARSAGGRNFLSIMHTSKKCQKFSLRLSSTLSVKMSKHPPKHFS